MHSLAGGNFSQFNDPAFNRKLAAAAKLIGVKRYRTYGKLDIELARDAAPAVAWGVFRFPTYLSRRTGCVVNSPLYGVDIAALCIRK